MKAITLWQPWASLLACGAKEYETRSWATNYRGPIAIHAAVTPFQRIIKKVFPLHKWADAPDYTLKAKFVELISKYIDINNLIYGSIIATAELVGCHKIEQATNGAVVIHICEGVCEDYHEITGDELLFGDWTPGRYAWEFANMKMLETPIPAKGKQGLWNWDGEAT